MDTSVIHIQEEPVKWALAGVTAYLGVQLDVESLAWFFYISLFHSIVGSIKAMRVSRTWKAFQLERFASGFLKYISILLLMLMFSLTANVTGLKGYDLMAKYTVWGMSGILVYYSVVNVRSIWSGVDHKKEDLIEALFSIIQTGAKNAMSIISDFGKRKK